MGILTWLFGDRSPKERARSNADAQEGVTHRFGSAEFLEIPSRNFFGLCSRSSDGHYTLVWRDGNDAGTGGGARHSGQGRYILLEGDRIVAEGRMARPNDGKVANNGVFILNDWEFSAELSGTFFALRPDGRQLLSRKFHANLFNNGLSADGHLAVCQTCNSPDTADSSILTVFDLVSLTEVASWRPESGWANFYEFPAGGRTIRLGYPTGGGFDYSISGDFIGRERWIDTQLESGNLMLVETLLKEAGEDPPLGLVERLIASIVTTLRSGSRADNRTKAWALKLLGMCYEAKSSPTQALTAYEQALSLDPKIGVKRRAQQLRTAFPNRTDGV